MFARKHTERSRDWNIVINTCKIILQRRLQLHKDNGLVADFLRGDASNNYKPVIDKVLELDYNGYYNWNGRRIPWRLTQYYLYSRDESVKPHLNALKSFYEKVDNGYICAGYKLNGNSLVSYTAVTFLALVAYLLKGMGSSKLSGVNDNIDERYNNSTFDYFHAAIYLLTKLQAE
jgi:hypothetical protein